MRREKRKRTTTADDDKLIFAQELRLGLDQVDQ
jgi:hypothetical protein